MSEIALSAGTIDYQDTGGDGPAIVLLHGLLMDASLWDDVIGALSADHRVVAPTLPLGAHRHAMRSDADLSRLVEIETATRFSRSTSPPRWRVPFWSSWPFRTSGGPR